MNNSQNVIPAQAGIYIIPIRSWIPALRCAPAGMTIMRVDSGSSLRSGRNDDEEGGGQNDDEEGALNKAPKPSFLLAQE